MLAAVRWDHGLPESLATAQQLCRQHCQEALAAANSSVTQQAGHLLNVALTNVAAHVTIDGQDEQSAAASEASVRVCVLPVCVCLACWLAVVPDVLSGTLGDMCVTYSWQTQSLCCRPWTVPARL